MNKEAISVVPLLALGGAVMAACFIVLMVREWRRRSADERRTILRSFNWRAAIVYSLAVIVLNVPLIVLAPHSPTAARYYLLAWAAVVVVAILTYYFIQRARGKHQVKKRGGA